MKTVKMSLENIKGKMSRMEMKNIMAGSEGGNPCNRDGFPCHDTACFTSTVNSGICAVKNGVCGCYSV